MDRNETRRVFETQLQDLIDVCPHCTARVHLNLVSFDSHLLRNRDVVYYALFRCIPCTKLVLKTFRFSQNTYDSNENLSVVGWEDKFPPEELSYAERFEGRVPQEVLIDFREGVVSIGNQCPRAAVSMFRRALQSSLLERGANQEEDLIQQIRNAAFLTQDIKDWAHNIRILGNWGAHPQDDNLREVTLEVARETQAFLEEFFNYVYVMPSRVAEARKRNNPEPVEEDNEEE